MSRLIPPNTETWTETNFSSVIAKRLQTLERLNENRENQGVVLEACRRDMCLWINEWCWTFDPRPKDLKSLPFILMPHQDDFITWLQERYDNDEDGLLEKSRDFGATWLCSAFAVHKWLFEPGFRCGFGSRKLELVDKIGDPKSIFYKVRFLIENLPYWMRPSDYTLKEKSLQNNDNGATISGEGGDEIGRGDRTSIYFVDESASLPRPDAADAALSQTTRIRIDLSTPKGNGNPFYRRRHGGIVSVFTAHWKEDERKNHYRIEDAAGNELVTGKGRPENHGHTVPVGGKVIYPWYEAERRRLEYNDVVIAQELDIDYAASIEGVCIPAKWVMAAVDLVKKVPQLATPGPLIGAMDLADTGLNLNVLGFRRGVVVQEKILAWRHESQSYNATKAKEECASREASELNYDTGGGYGGGMADLGRGMVATHDDANRDLRLKLMGEAPGPHDASTVEIQEWQHRAVEELAALKGKHLPFKLVPRQSGAPPSKTEWPDGNTSQDKFINARAENWWILRERFRKTYDVVELGILHPLDQLISIPNDPALLVDLSKPLVSSTTGGKIVLESKEKMRKRGVKSPDYGDMLSMLFAPPPALSWASEDDMMESLRTFYSGGSAINVPDKSVDPEAMLDAFDAYLGGDIDAMEEEDERRQPVSRVVEEDVPIIVPKGKFSL